MIRRLTISMGAVVLAACGAGPGDDAGPGTYEDALDRQSRLIAELTSALAEVTDEASAEAAAPRIEELSAQLQRLAVHINEMPPRSFEESQRLTEERAAGRAESRRESARQMRKIEQYPVLQEAWKRGMQEAGG